ncbi:MAG: hypothetical protein D8M56_12955 [Chloroflexi bacterium]|nr:hypothetical protein [Chloroflexota bacterium]
MSAQNVIFAIWMIMWNGTATMIGWHAVKGKPLANIPMQGKDPIRGGYWMIAGSLLVVVGVILPVFGLTFMALLGGIGFVMQILGMFKVVGVVGLNI